MSKDGSGNLEIYFSVRDAVLKKPFFFHHIPKTAGSSLRYVVRRWLLDAGCHSLIVQDAARELSEGWPDSVARHVKAVAELGRLEAILSHYTARAADILPGHVVALVRNPDDQLASNLRFHPSLLKSKLRAIFKKPLVNNSQIRSLTGRDFPNFAPKSNKDRRRWRSEALEMVRNCSLYRSEDYPAFLGICRDEYGMVGLQEGPRRKVGKTSPDIEDRLPLLAVELERNDPVWLDRVLYERAASLTNPA